jgi:hypothetical protein
MARKALCIGINNDHGTDIGLAGCVNDAHDWCALLAKRGLTVQKLADARVRVVANGCRSGTVTRAVPEAPEADGARPRFMAMATCLPAARKNKVFA